MPMKPCSVPSCGELTRGDYCKPHSLSAANGWPTARVDILGSSGSGSDGTLGGLIEHETMTRGQFLRLRG